MAEKTAEKEGEEEEEEEEEMGTIVRDLNQKGQSN